MSTADREGGSGLYARVSRRRFLQAGAASLVIAWTAPSVARAGRVTASARQRSFPALNGFVEIDADGRVTLVCHRAEMGQGVYTAIPQLLAEELEVDVGTVRVEFAPVDRERYGSQVTGGSSSIRANWRTLLLAGATARDLLVRAAAARWRVQPSECLASSGRVHHPPSARSLGYGELVDAAARLEPAREIALKRRREWRVAGRARPRLDTRAKVDGTATFGLDLRLPGLLHAVVERAPRFEGRIASVDADAALRVPGVIRVVRVGRDVFGHRHEGVAVVAGSTWAAMQGRRLLRVAWDDSAFAHEHGDDLRRRQLAALDDGPIFEHRVSGDPAAASRDADAIVEAVYETPYQAHACLEPPNCTAHVTAERVDVWGPMQAPDWVQEHLARVLGRPRSEIHVHLTFLGGGFGRKALADYPTEAALLARELGRPVQVVWTREDDLSQGPFRPGMAYRCRAALRKGRLHAFESVGSGQNIGHQVAGADARQPNGSLLEGLPEPYLASIPNVRFADAPLRAAVPVVWWRAVYSSTNSFAFESFLDEAALAAGADPFEFRRRHLHGADARRHRDVLDELERVAGWAGRDRAGSSRGWGMSFVEAFESRVGQVVVVARGARGLLIERVCVVIDCGWTVNPDIVRAQIEGSIVMALGAAALHEVRFADGRATTTDFTAYPLPRLTDVPAIEVHVLDSDDPPGGVGEPAVPGFAPALANAIFDLTGHRWRRLPIDLGSA